MDDNPSEPPPVDAHRRNYRSLWVLALICTPAIVGIIAGSVQGSIVNAELPRHLRCGNTEIEYALTCFLAGAFGGSLIAFVVRRL